MNQNKLTLDRDVIKKDKRKLSPKAKSAISGGILCLALVSSIFYAGYQVSQATIEKPVPANEQCRKFAQEVPKFYQTKMREIFGEAPPQASLTKEQLQTLAQDCDKNINVYTFTIQTEVTTTTVGK